MSIRIRQFVAGLLSLVMAVLPLHAGMASMGDMRHCQMHETQTMVESSAQDDRSAIDQQDCCQQTNTQVCNNQCGHCGIATFVTLSEYVLASIPLPSNFSMDFVEEQYRLRNPLPLLRPPANLHS